MPDAEAHQPDTEGMHSLSGTHSGLLSCHLPCYERHTLVGERRGCLQARARTRTNRQRLKRYKAAQTQGAVLRAECNTGLLKLQKKGKCMEVSFGLQSLSVWQELNRRIEEALACPCIDDIKAGPCGPSFVAAFACFIRSQAKVSLPP